MTTSHAKGQLLSTAIEKNDSPETQTDLESIMKRFLVTCGKGILEATNLGHVVVGGGRRGVEMRDDAFAGTLSGMTG